jgi:hypothetical protein
MEVVRKVRVKCYHFADKVNKKRLLKGCKTFERLFLVLEGRYLLIGKINGKSYS